MACFAKKHLERNEMWGTIDKLGESLRDVCGTVVTHEHNVSRDLFFSKVDTFALECEESDVGVAFLYICTHGERDSDGNLRLLMKKKANTEASITGRELRDQIQELRRKMYQRKVIVFLECCHAGTLFDSGSKELGTGIGIQHSLEHPTKRKVMEGSGTVVFMSCGPEEESSACVFASCITEFLESYRNDVTAEMLIDEVTKMVKSKTRNSDRPQNPKYAATNLKEVGVIGGVSELEQSMGIEFPVHSQLGQRKGSQHLFKDSWTEEDFIKKAEDANELINDLRQKLQLGDFSYWEEVDKITTAYKELESEKTRIVFCGESGCGKSTLINALVGHRILPTGGGDSGCTAAIIEIKENKESNNFKAVVNILERAHWLEEAESLNKILTSGSDENCDEVLEAKKLLTIVYGSSDAHDLRPEIDQLLEAGRKEIEYEDLSKFREELSCYLSHGVERNEYWPVVKSVEIFMPDCEVLKEGLVLVDIPGFLDPNPVKKDLAEKEYGNAKNICFLGRTVRSGVNDTFQKLLKDYNERLREYKEVTFVLTKSDDGMDEPDSYMDSLGKSVEGYNYLRSLREKADDEDNARADEDYQTFRVECAKFRNRKSREALRLKIKDESEDETSQRPIHSVSGLDYTKIRERIKRSPPRIFRTLDETGVPGLLESLEKTVGNHGISKIKRFLSDAVFLQAAITNEMETDSSNQSHHVTSDVQDEPITGMEVKVKSTVEECKKEFDEMQNVLLESLNADFNRDHADRISVQWKRLHHMSLKAAFVRKGQHKTKKGKFIDLYCDLLTSIYYCTRVVCVPHVARIEKLISDFYEEDLDDFVESGLANIPGRSAVLLIIGEKGCELKDDLCENLAKFLRTLRSKIVQEMSIYLKPLWLQQVDDGISQASDLAGFVSKVLSDAELKKRLQRLIERELEKEESYCREKFQSFIKDAHCLIKSFMEKENQEAKSGVPESIQQFTKKMEDLLELSVSPSENEHN